MRSADRTLIARPDPIGVVTLHTREMRPGWVPSMPRGRRCPSRPARNPQPPPAASQRPVPVRRYCCHLRSQASRDIVEGSRLFTRPAFPSPVPPRWDGSPWASPSSFTPPSPAAHVEVGTGSWALARDYAADICSALLSAHPLITCAFVSHSRLACGPRPSDGADPSLRRQGCSRPILHPQDRAALSFTRPLRWPGAGLATRSVDRRLVAHQRTRTGSSGWLSPR